MSYFRLMISTKSIDSYVFRSIGVFQYKRKLPTLVSERIWKISLISAVAISQTKHLYVLWQISAGGHILQKWSES